MRLSSWPAWIAIAIVTAWCAPAHAAPSVRSVSFASRDGVRLAGTLLVPDDPGPHPAVVLTASWGQHNLEYIVPAYRLASRGYVVLSYTARGFFDSGGEITVAGPEDVADLSAAIDYLIATTPTDPSRIGAAGMSYAAGIALLATAFDPRIRAVVALSGWSDLSRSLYWNQTRSHQSLAFLLGLATLTGRASPEMDAVLGDFDANRNIDALIAYGSVRGAGAYLERINAHRPAILLASAWGETIFPINQLAGFFDQLVGPRRWELRPGDHALPEIPGLAGLHNDAWASLDRWFDHHLRGDDNGIDREPAIALVPRTGRAPEAYAALPAMSDRRARFYLGPLSASGPGAMYAAAPAAWSRTVTAGIDTLASAGTCLLSGGIEAITGVPPVVWLPVITSFNAATWVNEPLATPVRVRGAGRIHLTVTPGSDGQTSVFAYLYDVDVWGVGRLITHVPVTLRDAVAGRAVAVDEDLFMTAYDVPAGHRLAVVVDTVDPLYLDAAPLGSTVTLGGDAYVELPLRSGS